MPVRPQPLQLISGPRNVPYVLVPLTSTTLILPPCLNHPQGVLSRPDNRFKLSDPAVHCTDLLRFSHTNLGDKGMELFFRTHQCNGICCALGLGRHPAQPSAGATSMAATGTTLRK